VRAEIAVSQQRLKTTIAMAQKYGMKIILAPSHLPGRLFTTRGEQPDLRMWAGTRFRSQIVALWSDLARELRGVKEIIGYDLINEPFTPEDTSVDFLDYTPSASDRVLADLYRDTVVAIREHDRTRPIVLEAPCWANPLALSAIHPLPNQRIVYSFHMYTPHRYTMRAQNRRRYSYPGRVPRWPNAPAAEPDLWDKSKIEQFLGHVVAWQSTHDISSHQIFVGEFGVTRDSLGAAAYLTDLTAVFRQNDWRWCLYAFRDDAWDAMDYELSDDLGNMLYRRRNSLFDVVASQFR
jgi:aryl-phospho-beta-D-glucosidase BglC (GH1 family)